MDNAEDMISRVILGEEAQSVIEGYDKKKGDQDEPDGLRSRSDRFLRDLKRRS